MTLREISNQILINWDYKIACYCTFLTGSIFVKKTCQVAMENFGKISKNSALDVFSYAFTALHLMKFSWFLFKFTSCPDQIENRVHGLMISFLTGRAHIGIPTHVDKTYEYKPKDEKEVKDETKIEENTTPTKRENESTEILMNHEQFRSVIGDKDEKYNEDDE